MRARHDDALVDVKGLPGEPGLLQEIGQRHALIDAPCRQLLDALDVRGGSGVRQIGVERQAEAAQYEPGGLIARIVGAVTVGERSGGEPPRGPLDQLAKRQGSSVRSASR